MPLNKHLKTYVIVNFQNCKELINSVEETGLILREIRDLEDQVLYETYWYQSIVKQHSGETL